MKLGELTPLSPAFFFQLSCEVEHVERRKKRLNFLPDTSFLLGEKSFASLSLYWSEKGLFFALKVEKPLGEVFYPKFSQGDALELFIDTRDNKSAKRIHPFCHHFLVLPQKVDEIQFEEKTTLPLEEKRELSSPSLVLIETKLSRSQYEMNIEIPKEAFHGYDPSSFPKLGFTYRLHRFRGEMQHFAYPSHHFAIEKHPELWASVQLK